MSNSRSSLVSRVSRVYRVCFQLNPNQGTDYRSLLSRVRFVHKRNLAGNSCPFEFTPDRVAAFLLLQLVPFEKFITIISISITKAQLRLKILVIKNIEPTRIEDAVEL